MTIPFMTDRPQWTVIFRKGADILRLSYRLERPVS
jgi:hypothetical protein